MKMGGHGESMAYSWRKSEGEDVTKHHTYTHIDVLKLQVRALVW